MDTIFKAKKKGDFGNVCIFMARLCGAVAAVCKILTLVISDLYFLCLCSVVVLICGLISLLPLPSLTTSLSGYPRCVGVGFIFM